MWMSTPKAPPSDYDLKDIDSDRLIRLVEIRPVLWQSKEVKQKHQQKSTKPAWEEVCMELLEQYQQMNEEQKLKFRKLVRTKWTRARDNWQKRYRPDRNEPQPPPGSKERDGYEKLKFLEEVYKKKVEPVLLKKIQEQDQHLLNISENSVDSEASTVLNIPLHQRPSTSTDKTQNFQPLTITNETNSTPILGRSATETVPETKLQISPPKNQETEEQEENTNNTSIPCPAKIKPNECISLDSEDEDPYSSNEQQEETRENATFKVEPEEFSNVKRKARKRPLDEEDWADNKLIQGFYRNLTPYIKDFDKEKLLKLNLGVLQLVQQIRGN